MPSAPLKTSSQSRKRLQTYRFEAKPTVDEDKENPALGSPNNGAEAVDSPPRTLSQPAGLVAQLSQPPRTPASKIPLAELIANTEDALNRLPAYTTPNDHVFWQHGPRSSEPGASQTSATRGKKRARSSSPASSQLDKPVHVSGQNDSLNLETLQQSLHTPKNDPQNELWTRYTQHELSTSNAKALIPRRQYLISSSPQSPGTMNRGDSALKRSTSCGVQWPTSKGKRRKTDAEWYGRTRNIFAAAKDDIMAQDICKISKVNLLLDKIGESLAKRAPTEDDGLSSSSPLPERVEPHPNISPVHIRIEDPPPKDEPRFESSGNEAEERIDNLTKIGTSSGGRSSEFGDDDIDMDFVVALEAASTNPKQLNQHIGGALERTSRQMPPPLYSTPSTLHCPSIPKASDPPSNASKSEALLHTAAKAHSDHEFSDGFSDDDAVFANDLQDLAAQYETQADRPMPRQESCESSFADELTGKLLPKANADGFDDEFDDDDLWNDVAKRCDDTRAGPKVGSTSQKNVDNRAIKRYLILDVVDSHYETDQGRRRPEKYLVLTRPQMLSLKDERTRMLKIVLLRQSWYDSRCTKGSYIHLIGEFDRTGQCIVDDCDNMIILHPDHLISATVVADSFTCTRKAALQDRIKATGVAEKPQVYGQILHEIFQEGLRANNWEMDRLRAIIERILPTHIESLHEINVPIPEAINYLVGKMPEMKAWASVFISAVPCADALIHDRNGSVASMSINKLLEVEEHVWSPMYGLKGNIDATVQVSMALPNERQNRTLTIPLEFKTGKKDNNEMHRAQTALYTLLLSDRYDLNVTCGVLYYLETSRTFRVEGIRNEIRQMIIQRNELACFVHEKLDLPPMLKKEFSCKNCYAKTPCFIYHKLVEDGTAETSGVKEVFEQTVSHLKPIHQEFFKKWDDLLTKEERDSMKFRRELWTMLSTEREALGRCFANVAIEPGSAYESDQGPKINRFQYTFLKHNPNSGFSFTESQLTIGEPIVISDERGHFALANGFVTNVRATRISVAVDRRLHNVRQKGRDFDPVNNQVFTGIMELAPDGTPSTPQLPDGGEPMLYRLDKDEFANGMAIARNNVLRIMEKDLFRARELREQIIEGATPSFKPSSSAYSLAGPASQQNINIDQRQAIEKVMSAKDYALVLGMPGTGKTTTIAHIIRALVSQNKSVLLTSYTHTAVDNILLKIKDDNIPILRLGAVGKIHAEVKLFADLAAIPKKTIAELDHSYVHSKVVATTCLGVGHPIFNARIFDYCIVDEASQITLPVCLGPIRMARTFILVGDHFQLPPLVQNKTAREAGLDISLFKMLSDAHPESVVNLEHQYRMAEDIMLLSNKLIYSGRLKCGTASVASRMLDIPNLELGLSSHHHSPASLPKSSGGASSTPPSICLSSASPNCWLRRALSPPSRCLFLNTDKLSPPARETVAPGSSRITNTAESALTAQLVATLVRSGVAPRAIGVITFYRSQLALLRADMRALVGAAIAADVETHTADKYQGRDKEVIVLSCVRSNTDGGGGGGADGSGGAGGRVGELLRDWRRVNVAVTRARSKLLVLGSHATLGSCAEPVWEGLVRTMDEAGWVLDLPPHAAEMHIFERIAGTQVVMSVGGSGRSGTEALRSGGSSPSPKKKGKRPLEEGSGNNKENTPSTARKEGGRGGRADAGSFRKPARLVHGALDLDKLLDRRPVLRDVANGI